MLIDFDEGLSVTLVSNDDLIAGVNWEAQLYKDRIASLNGVLRIGKHNSTVCCLHRFTPQSIFVSYEFQPGEVTTSSPSSAVM
jgi:hypothetical protein